MSFARSVWKILVAIKDGLVLLFLLLFFAALYAALSSRPSPGMVRDGALYLNLDGGIVEEASEVSPASLLMSGDAPQPEYVERDLVRAIEAAATDSRIKAVVLDLEQFTGGSGVQVASVGAALDKVRAAKKPVLVRALIYNDDTVQLAAHASEAWVDPMGGVAITGPGGTMLFYKGLLDKLKVNAHVFKVGTYKSAVEPFIRSESSPESREALNAVLGAVWQNWQDDVKRARPKADLRPALTDPVKWVADAGGDAAQAAVKSGLVDRVGDRVAFGKRVAEIVGADSEGPLGAFKATELGTYLADKSLPSAGKAIAVVTVAGEIVDGDAGPGTAGGDRISDLVDSVTQSDDYAGLVLRVDSPGGSVMASERIRAAVERVRAKGLPVAVSMGSVAASGGYWVSTPAQRIFAEPSTITGSIGVFAVMPSFEATLPEYGVTTEQVRTTPLSGQPDLLGGLNPQVSALLQGQVEQTYGRFIGYVAKSRGKTPAEIDKIGQGRIWDGGTARQLGLVDEFGNLDAAVAWTAKKAGATEWHAEFVQTQPSPFVAFLKQMESEKGTEARAQDLAGALSARQQDLFMRVQSDVTRLIEGGGMRAYCLECASDDRSPPPRGSGEKLGMLQLLARLFG
ncbi:signal peptide peptidase SppA [Novosphingobium sp. MMS21-SN21R]|uniref:signal peptide peptidase SppA n=1 Tax=Novosphingobium sp. MMS21-SN21R TaxID=2969298 RepID=UPI002888D1F9|nr:signal peptide peptidase SppA [Novosphingobium sp. MMS21-SN21R]MDT0506882.1 signal peptide peptidase SppA [Novosphingobium sp. MMS21-SN21R]